MSRALRGLQKNYETCRREELVGYEVMEMILDKETFPEYHQQCVALKGDYESHYRESLKDISLIKYILDGTDKPSKRYNLESKVIVDDLFLKEICCQIQGCLLLNILDLLNLRIIHVFLIKKNMEM